MKAYQPRPPESEKPVEPRRADERVAVAPTRELSPDAILRLQPQAGNARVAALLRAGQGTLLRASVGWPGAKAINAAQKPSGSCTRFPIGAMTTVLPAGGTHPEEVEAKQFTDEDPEQRAVVLVPTALLSTPPSDVDVLFFLHGHNIGWREGKKTSTDRPGYAFKDKVRDEEDDNIAGQLPATMVAVLPQGTAVSNFGAIDTDALAKEALGAVPGWSKVKPRRVVLSAHSGGGKQMTALLESKQKTLADRQTERKARLPGLSEVVMFDAINGDDQLNRTASFVNDSIDEDIATLETKSSADQLTHLESSMRFRAFYSLDGPERDPAHPEIKPGFYQPFHQRLKRMTIGPKLPAKVPTKHSAIDQAAWDKLRENYKIESKGQSHAKKLAGGNLAAGLGALKPGATPTFPVTPPKPPPTPKPATTTLREGMVGPQVQGLQDQLNEVAPAVAVAEVTRGGGELALAREALEAEHAGRDGDQDEALEAEDPGREGDQDQALEAEHAGRDGDQDEAGGRARGSRNEQPVFPLTPDGKYGPRTRAAVLAFQRSHGLTADGIAGPQTRAALNAETLITAGPRDGAEPS